MGVSGAADARARGPEPAAVSGHGPSLSLPSSHPPFPPFSLQPSILRLCSFVTPTTFSLYPASLRLSAHPPVLHCSALSPSSQPLSRLLPPFLLPSPS
eukprot:3155290-Rhodomonas_salina.1